MTSPISQSPFQSPQEEEGCIKWKTQRKYAKMGIVSTLLSIFTSCQTLWTMKNLPFVQPPSQSPGLFDGIITWISSIFIYDFPSIDVRFLYVSFVVFAPFFMSYLASWFAKPVLKTSVKYTLFVILLFFFYYPYTYAADHYFSEPYWSLKKTVGFAIGVEFALLFFIFLIIALIILYQYYYYRSLDHVFNIFRKSTKPEEVENRNTSRLAFNIISFGANVVMLFVTFAYQKEHQVPFLASIVGYVWFGFFCLHALLLMILLFLDRKGIYVEICGLSLDYNTIRHLYKPFFKSISSMIIKAFPLLINPIFTHTMYLWIHVPSPCQTQYYPRFNNTYNFDLSTTNFSSFKNWSEVIYAQAFYYCSPCLGITDNYTYPNSTMRDSLKNVCKGMCENSLKYSFADNFLLQNRDIVQTSIICSLNGFSFIFFILEIFIIMSHFSTQFIYGQKIRFSLFNICFFEEENVITEIFGKDDEETWLNRCISLDSQLISVVTDYVKPTCIHWKVIEILLLSVFSFFLSLTSWKPKVFSFLLMVVLIIWLLYSIFCRPHLSLGVNVLDIVSNSITLIFSLFIIYGAFHPYSIEKSALIFAIIGTVIIILTGIGMLILDCLIISHPFDRNEYSSLKRKLEKVEERRCTLHYIDQSCIRSSLAKMDLIKDTISYNNETTWDKLDQLTSILDWYFFLIIRVLYGIFVFLLGIGTLLYWPGVYGRNIDRYLLDC